MDFEQSQLEELEQQCDGVSVVAEGQDTFVLLKGLHFLSGAQEHVMDALLAPGGHTGYVTRLFLERQVAGKGNNWQPHQIFGRTWHTWSWKDVAADQRLAQILTGHLVALL